MTGPRRGWLAALAAAVVFRLWDLGRLSLSMDEVWEIQIASAPWADIHLIHDGFPPLFHYLLKPAIGLFGYAAPRWMAALAGLATIWVVYRLGEAVRSGLGLPAATLLAWLPLHIHLSREGRVYPLVILAAAVALWAAYKSRWGWYAVAVVTSLWLHYAMAALAVMLALWTLMNKPDRRQWLSVHVFIGALVAPLIFPLLGDLTPHTTVPAARDPGLGEVAFLGKALLFGFALGPSARDLHTMTFGEALAAILPWALILAPAAIWIGANAWRKAPGTRAWAMVAIAGLVLTIALILLAGIGFQVRYFAWLMVPLCVLLASGLDRRPVTVAAAGVCAAAMVFSAASREFVPDHQTEDTRAAAEFISTREEPAFALAWYMANPINFYLTPEAFLPLEDPRTAEDMLGPRNKPGQRVRPLSTGVGGSEPEAVLKGLMDEDLQPGDAYLLVYSRTFHGDDDGSFRASLEAEDGLVPVFTAAGVEVLRGVRSG